MRRSRWLQMLQNSGSSMRDSSAGGTRLARPTVCRGEPPLSGHSVDGGRTMETIQVADQVAIEVNLHEVQIHLKWDEYDIAIPLHVARQLAEGTDQLVEHVGPLADTH